MRGSFDAGFVVQNVADTPTILTGPLASHARALEERGLLVAREGVPSTPSAARLRRQSRGVTLHVTPDGRNDGGCTLETPCTLTLALSVARPGDAVLIGGGEYAIPPDVAGNLIRPDIVVRGGYLDAQAFVAAAPLTRPSYVTGPRFELREALAERGLTLVHDRKVLAISNAIDAGSAGGASTVQEGASCDAAAGMAGSFPCKGIDLLAHMPLGAFSSEPQDGNDVWGFVDNRDNREYALVGLSNGTAVVDVTDPRNPREVGTIGGHPAGWRDIKVYQLRREDGDWQAYGYVTADHTSEPQGLQIIDLSGLPDSISLAAPIAESVAHTISISRTWTTPRARRSRECGRSPSSSVRTRATARPMR